MVAADANPAPHSDISDGAASDAGRAPDGPGFGFVQMMQNGVGVPKSTVISPQTVPHPMELGARGAVAMLMQAGARVMKDGTEIITDDPAAVLTKQGEVTASDLMAGLANPVPIQVTGVVIPLQSPAAPATADLTASFANAPPPESVALEGVARLVTTPATNAEVKTPATPFADKLQRVLAGTLPQPAAAITGPAPSGGLVLAPPPLPTSLQIQQTPESPPPAPAGASATHLPAAQSELPKAGRVTPAETAFRLRANAGEGDVVATAVNAPAQVPDRVTPKPLMTPQEHAPDMSPANQDAEPKPLADRPVATPAGIATDVVPLTAAMGGSDPAKPSPTVIAQPGSGYLTTAPAPTALPQHLSADLVNLAKTSPSGPVEILLNPAELGNLRFEIHQKADQLRVVVSVERPETMELLRRNSDQLLAEFKAAGFTGAQLSFGRWDQHSSDSRPPPAPPPLHQDWASDPPPPAKTLHPSPELASPTGLNIRL